MSATDVSCPTIPLARSCGPVGRGSSTPLLTTVQHGTLEGQQASCGAHVTRIRKASQNRPSILCYSCDDLLLLFSINLRGHALMCAYMCECGCTYVKHIGMGATLNTGPQCSRTSHEHQAGSQAFKHLRFSLCEILSLFLPPIPFPVFLP